jgi:hypothetical protein
MSAKSQLAIWFLLAQKKPRTALKQRADLIHKFVIYAIFAATYYAKANNARQ